MSLHRLVYYSLNCISGDDVELKSEIEAILSAAQRNNIAQDVTGALLFNRGCFAQVLEGPLAGVESVFETIQQDPRHHEVTVLDVKPIEQRSFGQWAMAFVGEDVKDRAVFSALEHDSGFDWDNMSGDALYQTLIELTQEQEQAVA